MTYNSYEHAMNILRNENEMYKEKEKKIRDILFKTNIWNEDMVKIFRVIEEGVEE